MDAVKPVLQQYFTSLGGRAITRPNDIKPDQAQTVAHVEQSIANNLDAFADTHRTNAIAGRLVQRDFVA